MKTLVVKSGVIKRNWYLVDASQKILGRLSTEVARRLRGKHRVEYSPHVDIGDYIIIINADKIQVTGNKYYDKIYYHHTGYIGNLKKFSFKEMIQRNPVRIIEYAVKGMLPKGPLGRLMFRKLKVYAGCQHSHIAQQPQILDI
ncbi:MAG: 50S ribosomal protein L13 [Candidatus Dasytiphilus stammeri]